MNGAGYRRPEHKACCFNCVYYDAVFVPLPMYTSLCAVSKSDVGERKTSRDEKEGEEGVMYGIILMDSCAGSAILG